MYSSSYKRCDNNEIMNLKSNFTNMCNYQKEKNIGGFP